MDGSIVVIDVNPVANLLAGAVEFRLDAGQDVGNLARNKFLNVLVWSVVIRAIGDGCLNSEAAHPGAHQHVA